MLRSILGLMIILMLVSCEASTDEFMLTISGIRSIENAIKMYKLDVDRYPSEKEGLAVLVGEIYLESLPKDQWGNDFIYMVNDSTDIVVFSAGKNGFNENCKNDDVCI